MAQNNLFYGHYAVFMVVKSVYVLKSVKHGQEYNDILRIILFVLCLYILCSTCVNFMRMSIYDPWFWVQWASTLIS